MLDQLNRLPQYTVILGLIMLFAELFLGIETGFDLIMIGSILIASGMLGTITHSYELMAVTAIILSIIYLFLGRSYIKNKIGNLHVKTNVDKIVGHEGIVTKHIEIDHPGQVKIDDEMWRAKADQPIAPNTRVKAVSINGVTLTVSKIEKS